MVEPSEELQQEQLGKQNLNVAFEEKKVEKKKPSEKEKLKYQIAEGL